jgi:hypothetical protein
MGFLRMPMLGPGKPAPGEGARVHIVRETEIPPDMMKFVAKRRLCRCKVGRQVPLVRQGFVVARGW